MDVIRGFQNLSVPFQHPVVTIGNFDGVHLGHQQIIQIARREAQARKGQCIVYTFRPHPQLALRPAHSLPLLSTYDEKLEILENWGVDGVVEEPFSREFSTLEPEIFFREVLMDRIGAEAIVVGYDFAFGRERHGHLEQLRQLCKEAGIPISVVEPYHLDNETVSSSRIRQYLLAGQIEPARRLLGHDFYYKGVVIRGQGRGHQIGFPTANLKLENKLALPHGVYATWAEWGQNCRASVTNIGVRPTFATQEHGMPVWVETHLLDTDVDLYGATLKVRFCRRLREEKKFPNVEALVHQIRNDVGEARKILNEMKSA